MQNGYIESRDGKFRDECSNESSLTSLTQGRAVIASREDGTRTRFGRTEVADASRQPNSPSITE